MKLPKRAKKGGPVETAAPLSARVIHKNLLVSTDGTWAWFVLSPVQWAYKSVADREALLNVATLRWADLAGHKVHLRVTNHPTPFSTWAERLDRQSPNRIPDVEGTESWADYLAVSQAQIINSQLGETAVYLGVRLTTKQLKAEDLHRLTSDRHQNLSGDLDKVRKTNRRITEAIRKDGFNGNPVSARGLGWLMHSSVALGAPVATTSLAAATDGWGEHDMETFTGPVRVTAHPFSKTVHVRALREGAEHAHHAAILTASRMGSRDTENPALAPWLAYSQRLPFSVEWSAILDVIEGSDLAGRASFDKNRARNIADHYSEHGEEPPAEVGRAIADARRVEDEVTTGTRELAVRVSGPIRVAIFGRDEDDALSNVSEFMDAYARDERIEWTHPYAQYAHSREFIPGETLNEHPGHLRVMPGYYLATAVPNASAGLGDNVGPYIGQVIGGGRRAVFFDPTWGPRNNISGMVPIVAGLGGGKSALGGALVESAVRRGHRAVINDPSGALQNLVHLPYLRRHARHIELSGAEPGTLNPTLLVPEPRRQDYAHEAAWHAAIREAEAERRDLLLDTFQMLLPPQMVAREVGVLNAIEDAVNACGGTFGMNPWRVVRYLESTGEVGNIAATRLRQAAVLKGGALIFPESESRDDFATTADHDALLTVITMRGLTPPPTSGEREHWSRAERMAVPVLHLAARFAMRTMYADQDPKLVLNDEAGIAAAGASSFRSFVNRGSRDSRKHNCFFGVLMQNPGDALAISPEFNNLTGAAFVGRTTDADSAKASLRLLNVPAGHGYEQVLTRLETGQFLMRDWKGRVEKVQIDLSHRPALLEALNTTPRDPEDGIMRTLEEALA